MELRRLSLRNQALQDFLWAHLDPSELRWDYSKLDAMAELTRQEQADECQFWGDLSAPFVFRAFLPNPKVLEPHVMGDGRFFREALRQGLPIAWDMGVEVVRVWTQHDQLARIAWKCGFSFEAKHRGMMLAADGSLIDVISLTMTRTT